MLEGRGIHQEQTLNGDGTQLGGGLEQAGAGGDHAVCAVSFHAPAHGGFVPPKTFRQIQMDKGLLAALMGDADHVRQGQD